MAVNMASVSSMMPEIVSDSIISLIAFPIVKPGIKSIIVPIIILSMLKLLKIRQGIRHSIPPMME